MPEHLTLLGPASDLAFSLELHDTELDDMIRLSTQSQPSFPSSQSESISAWDDSNCIFDFVHMDHFRETSLDVDSDPLQKVTSIDDLRQWDLGTTLESQSVDSPIVEESFQQRVTTARPCSEPGSPRTEHRPNFSFCEQVASEGQDTPTNALAVLRPDVPNKCESRASPAGTHAPRPAQSVAASSTGLSHQEDHCNQASTSGDQPGSLAGSGIEAINGSSDQASIGVTSSAAASPTSSSHHEDECIRSDQASTRDWPDSQAGSGIEVIDLASDQASIDAVLSAGENGNEIHDDDIALAFTHPQTSDYSAAVQVSRNARMRQKVLAFKSPLPLMQAASSAMSRITKKRMRDRSEGQRMSNPVSVDDSEGDETLVSYTPINDYETACYLPRPRTKRRQLNKPNYILHTNLGICTRLQELEEEWTKAKRQLQMYRKVHNDINQYLKGFGYDS
ncbi:MAG: hypothetical protein Q9212_002984 [Teloschistes hypoglaucus]